MTATCHTRESGYQLWIPVYTEMTVRVDSRLHGNDDKVGFLLMQEWLSLNVIPAQAGIYGFQFTREWRSSSVIPAKAGIYRFPFSWGWRLRWIPVSTGMTVSMDSCLRRNDIESGFPFARMCDNCIAKFISLIETLKILFFCNKRDESRITIVIFTQSLAREWR
jgi:hypothetical protein